MNDLKKVLLVEDNPLNRMLIKKILSFYGSEVLEAVNGNEGIEKAKRYLPDLILMDLQLPEINGVEVIKILKETDKTKNIPIVAVSSNIREEEKIKAMEVGCAGFIEKPIDSRKFIENIRRHVS